jgi:hypothetical protein
MVHQLWLEIDFELTTTIEIIHDRFIGVWMANQNNTTTAKASVIADYVRALSVWSPGEREELVSGINGSKDQQALRFLSNSVLWNVVAQMTAFPIYCGLTQTMVLEWRTLSLTTIDVSNLLFQFSSQLI